MAATTFALLALAACSGKSGLVRDAEAAANAQGRDFSAPVKVRGLRERAVCGRSSGVQAIYREKAQRLMLQTEFEPQVWATLYKNWCQQD